MGINDYGGTGDALNSPPLGGPGGWAEAVAAALNDDDTTVDERIAAAVALIDAIPAGNILAGANVTIDLDSGANTVTISSSGGGGGTLVAEPGVLEFDDPAFAGADDDATLDNLMTYANAQTYTPTIRLRYGLTTLNSTHIPYTGFKLIGAGGNIPVEQIRSGAPYASRVNGKPGGGQYVFDLPSGNTHGMVVQGIAWEGSSTTSWLGSTNGGVLWTSVLRDLSFSAFFSVLGKRTQKLLNTAIELSGYWNCNNSYDTAFTLGGSDSLFWCGSQDLLDSPTSLNGSVQHHLFFDYQEKSYCGPGPFITAEGNPGAVRVDGSNSSGSALILMGMRMEGRNSGAPSDGSVLRVNGGRITVRDCWISYGYADPGATGRSGDLAVVTCAGGDTFLDGCFYSREAGHTTEDPFLVATGAGTNVIIRNMRTADDGGAWNGVKPVVQAVNGATIDADDSVRVTT